MALNRWWESNPKQKFWMEVTTRSDTGANLLAPQRDGAGRENWTYALVAEVKPGDRVLHYQTNETGGAGIIGWSEVTGPVSVGTITWQARGTRGRARGHATTGPSWFAPLSGLVEFDEVVRGADLGRLANKLMRLRAALEDEHGRSVYFPFFQYRPGEVRAQQGYLVKFPIELFDLIPDLSPALRAMTDTEPIEDDKSSGKVAPRGALTRIQDPVLRAAIERRSLDVAIKHYQALGAMDIVEVGKPYDLRLVVDGVERHVEVKGSSMEVQTVELTVNEVSHAHSFQPTDLVVVDGIRWSRQADGTVKTSGGVLRVWSDWTPMDEDLEARKFAYYLTDATEH